MADQDSFSARRAVFIERLKHLSCELGVAVYGCGCCGSPSLRDVWGEKGGHYKYDENGAPELTWSSTPRPSGGGESEA